MNCDSEVRSIKTNWLELKYVKRENKALAAIMGSPSPWGHGMDSEAKLMINVIDQPLIANTVLY